MHLLEMGGLKLLSPDIRRDASQITSMYLDGYWSFGPPVPGFDLAYFSRGGINEWAVAAQGPDLTVHAVFSDANTQGRVYSPFGGLVHESFEGASAFPYPKRFGGYLQVPVPAASPHVLLDAGYRLYSPEWGRFLGPDPVGLEVADRRTYNRFIHGWGNPAVYFDPDGLDPVCSPYIGCSVENPGLGKNSADFKGAPYVGYGNFSRPKPEKIGIHPNEYNAIYVGSSPTKKYRKIVRRDLPGFTEKFANWISEGPRESDTLYIYQTNIGISGAVDTIGNAVDWERDSIDLLAFAGHGFDSPHAEFDSNHTHFEDGSLNPDSVYGHLTSEGGTRMIGFEGISSLRRLKPLFSENAILVLSTCMTASSKKGHILLSSIAKKLGVIVVGSVAKSCGSYKLHGKIVACYPDGSCYPNEPMNANHDFPPIMNCIYDKNTVPPQILNNDKSLLEIQKKYDIW
ncbi:hypothetical protein KKB55_12940 [Myxococcota bacterium]|nr:hypothetical protein [Myxococcota bacterium]MBU1898647.1 hypothetical protein [Myxococcota bacterium]